MDLRFVLLLTRLRLATLVELQSILAEPGSMAKLGQFAGGFDEQLGLTKHSFRLTEKPPITFHFEQQLAPPK